LFDPESLSVYPHSSTGLLIKATRGILIAILFLSACGSQKDLPREVRSVVGILYVTGNEPFTVLSIQTDGGGVLRIRKDTAAVYQELWKFQGQKLRVRFRSVGSKSDTSSITVERYELVKNP
jgi:hypothetical protein